MAIAKIEMSEIWKPVQFSKFINIEFKIKIDTNLRKNQHNLNYAWFMLFLKIYTLWLMEHEINN